MIEQGLVMLLDGTGAVATLTAEGGGFLSELPKDQFLPSWSYLLVSHNPEATLTNVRGFAKFRIQIDCYGNTGPEVIALANAIDRVLQGFRGRLPDPDSTYVDSCFQSDLQDFPLDEAGRTFRRMLEYEICYANL